jgi:AbrB family looped-hinge helix DNA binding protein
VAHKAWNVVVGERGRLVLPAELRAELGISPGTRLLVDADPDGSLRLRPYRAVAEHGRGLLAGLAPAETSLVDDLLAERRRDATSETE